MSRRPQEEEESSQDSFLDVVANLVGVIIILVMLVGAKATHDALCGTSPAAPAEQVATDKPANSQELESQLKEARSNAYERKREVEQLATRLVQIKQEANDFDAERVNLAMHRSVVEEDLARRRELLDAEHKQQFDVQKKIAEYQLTLDSLTKEQLGLLNGPETVEELESVPTPLAREVDGDAIHLRLKDGLVSIVPFDELLLEVQNHVESIRRRLQSSDTVVDTFGPIDGYRIRMTVTCEQDPASIGGPRAGQLQLGRVSISTPKCSPPPKPWAKMWSKPSPQEDRYTITCNYVVASRRQWWSGSIPIALAISACSSAPSGKWASH